MFTFQVFVDSRKLGDALSALEKIAHEITTPRRVVNAVKRNGTVTARTPGAGLDLVMDVIRKHKATTLTAATMREMVKEAGFAPLSYSHFLNQAIKAGVIMRHKAGSNQKVTYTVRSGSSK